MAGPAAIFREIHRLRIMGQDLQTRVDLAPKQLQAQQNVIAKREEELKLGQDAVKKHKVALHEHDVSVKAENLLIKKYEHQLNDITSKKEYDALRHEIAGVREKIQGLEDETLTSMMELDELTGRLPALEEAVKKAKAEFAEFERDYQTRLMSWTQQLDEVNGLIAAQETKLPEEHRYQYERLVKFMGADALAAIEGTGCSACYTEMTAQTYHNALMQQFMACRSCGRILYTKDAR